jgi:hypothetical protein
MKKRAAALLTVGLIWTASIGLAVRSIMAIERMPGKVGSVSSAWPTAAELQPAPQTATIVLVAHPRCPCTKATLAQLAQIVTRSPRPLKGFVLFTRPSNLPATWTRTSLWEQASEIPGITAVEDVDGRRSALFGAATSGHVFLFDSGLLRFSGGITPGRGVAGECAGTNAILAWLRTGAACFDRTPVYGCSLVDSNVGR